LPVGDGAAEVPLLTLAAGCEVLHEGRTEQLLRGCGVCEPLGGLTQGARQLALHGELAIIGIAADRLVRPDAMLDTPQALTDHLAMNVAIRPRRWASTFTKVFKSAARSAASRASV